MRDEDGFGFLAGFCTGAAIGAMAALLFAPKPGRELRQELVVEGERLKDRAYGTARELRTRGSEAADQTRRAALEAARSVKEAARTIRPGRGRGEQKIVVPEGEI